MFEHGNEFMGSITCLEVLKKLHNWRLLKKGSAMWSFNNKSLNLYDHKSVLCANAYSHHIMVGGIPLSK
jgi:hypothetical protein